MAKQILYITKLISLLCSFKFHTADAVVSTGLSALGYEYINLGNFLYALYEIAKKLLRRRNNWTKCLFPTGFWIWADDCWAELKSLWGTTFEFIIFSKSFCFPLIKSVKFLGILFFPLKNSIQKKWLNPSWM